MLIIDEPDIYLHSDLQRQLVHLLRSRDGDVVIATHSTEILAEAEAGEILVLNKKGRAAHRVQNPTQLQALFGSLGSNLNPTITQLAKTKKAVFVEGEDFALISAFARKLGVQEVANRASFAVIPARGFNPARVADFSDGMATTLGVPIKRAVIFDRDYRSDASVGKLSAELRKGSEFVHIHGRKELENFLLVPEVLDRCVQARLDTRRSRGDQAATFDTNAKDLLCEVSESLKSEIFGQYNAHGVKAYCDANPGTDVATASAVVHKELEAKWVDFDERMKIVPGKEVLARFNAILQERYKVSLTTTFVVSHIRVPEIPNEMRELIEGLRSFSR